MEGRFTVLYFVVTVVTVVAVDAYESISRAHPPHLDHLKENVVELKVDRASECKGKVAEISSRELGDGETSIIKVSDVESSMYI